MLIVSTSTTFNLTVPVHWNVCKKGNKKGRYGSVCLSDEAKNNYSVFGSSLTGSTLLSFEKNQPAAAIPTNTT